MSPLNFYRVKVNTIYGQLRVNVFAETETQAFELACEEIQNEMRCAEIGSIDIIDERTATDDLLSDIFTEMKWPN